MICELQKYDKYFFSVEEKNYNAAIIDMVKIANFVSITITAIFFMKNSTTLILIYNYLFCRPRLEIEP